MAERRQATPKTLTDAAWQLLKFGIAVPAAAYMLWFLTSGLAGDVHAMRDEHLELRFFLRAICINGAGNEPAKIANCVPPSER